jgi:biotin carboxylase
LMPSTTNLAFHRKLCVHPDFVAGKLDTHFLEKAGFVA